jgi:YfiH family protein
MMMDSYLTPIWPAPSNVHAYTTTRQGGHSLAPYNSFNLADHVGDDITSVTKNRAILYHKLHLPSQPCWLEQTHSNVVVQAKQGLLKTEADACYTSTPATVCLVLTADCLPILICNRTGTEIAAIHAGWRGLAAGIIENTLAKLTSPTCELMAWLGPAIGPSAFEVGAEVYEAFNRQNPSNCQAFSPVRSERWYADLFGLAKLALARLGLTAVYGGQYCTYSDAELFFSYRRDGQTGRLASLIWFD